jgi:exopolysaccharide biosynthesis protein
MKNRKYLCFLIVILSVSISAQDFKTVQDGIEYAEVTRGTKEEPVHINLLRLDLKKVRLDVVHALDAAIGLEKTSSIASRHGAFAAINAGFFKKGKGFDGDAVGVMQIDGKLISESFADRVALLINNESKKTKTSIERVSAKFYILKDRFSYNALGINRAEENDDIIVFTPDLKTTPESPEKRTDFIFSGCKYSCSKVEVAASKGGTIISEDKFVLRFNEEKHDFLAKYLRKQSTAISPEWFTFFKVFETSNRKNYKKIYKTEDMIAGVPQLIKDSKIAITWQEEKIGKDFVETRHPRTAVAKLKDGKFLMVTVDGRQAGYSVGMNLNELAAFLLELGATDAMNLDGGGSTTMFLDGKVMNKPSDKEGERSVSDAILVTLRKKK